MASLDSDSEGSEDSIPGDSYRLNFPVGHLLPSDIHPGSCIGDDMRSKGANTTRFGALQANGAGGSPSALVAGWCLTIQAFLINVFCICETRIAPEWKHSLVENLFLEKGYVVLSHNRPSGELPYDPL